MPPMRLRLLSPVKHWLPALAAAPLFAPIRPPGRRWLGAFGLTSRSVSEADADFAVQAASSSLAEVALGRLGAERADAPRVAAYARRMVADHRLINADLMILAAARRILLPLVPPRPAQKVLDHLDSLAGPSFDAEFRQRMIADHERAIDLFRTQTETGQDPGLTSFAGRMLPILQRHLAEAHAL